MTAPREWDYIIVGGGSAGAVVAARLSERADRSVLLLEAGGWDWSPYIHVPGFLANVVFSRSLNWGYEGEPDPSLDGRRLTWMAGRVMGGSSSINGMVYGRGLPADYDRWEAAGATGWGWSDMEPWFKKAEHWSGPPGPGRGDSGPLQVRPFEDVHPACRSVVQAYVADGLAPLNDYCAGITDGIGLTQATQRGGWRHSTARAYLGKAARRPNLRVLTRSRALNLEMGQGRCVGVRFARRGAVAVARATREVVVTAGAIGTPKLLLLSGLGPADELAKLDIPVIADLPGTGRNLQDHVNVKLSASVAIKTYNSERSGGAKLLNGARFVATRSGPASSPANHAQGFVKSEPGLASADYQVQVMALGFNAEPDDRTNGVSIVVSPCQPEARGSVTLASADPATPPRIRIEMLGCENDVQILLRACRQEREMLDAGPCRDFAGKVFLPAPKVDTDAEWRAFMRETAGLNWHPTGTCRMGLDDDAVVGPNLLVRGVKGLSIADASVMPNVPSGNTNAPVIALAERAADLIAARTS